MTGTVVGVAIIVGAGEQAAEIDILNECRSSSKISPPATATSPVVTRGAVAGMRRR